MAWRMVPMDAGLALVFGLGWARGRQSVLLNMS